MATQTKSIAAKQTSIDDMIHQYLKNVVTHYKDVGVPSIAKLSGDKEEVKNVIQHIKQNSKLKQALQEEISSVSGHDVSDEHIDQLLKSALGSHNKKSKRVGTLANYVITFALDRVHDTRPDLTEDIEKHVGIIKPTTKIHQVLDKYNLPASIHKIIDNALWYLHYHNKDKYNDKRSALYALMENLGMSDEHSVNNIDKLVANPHNYIHLLRHDGLSKQEIADRSLAHGIVLAKHHPHSALVDAAMAATSPLTPPSINYLLGAHASLPLARGGHLLAHPAMADVIGNTGTFGIGKIQAIIHLSKKALDNDTEPPPNLDDKSKTIWKRAVSYLQDLANRAEKGVEIGGTKYQINKHELSPQGLASLFLTATHKTEDMKPVWSVATHVGRKIAALAQLEHSLRHFVGVHNDKLINQLTQINMHGTPQQMIELAESVIASKHPRETTFLRKYLDNAKKQLADKSIKLLSDSEVAPIPKEHHDVVPGIMGLGPKVGAYGANLLGHMQHVTVDTWEGRNMGVRLGRVSGKSGTSIEPIITPRKRLENIRNINQTAKEIIALGGKPLQQLPKHIANAVEEKLNKLQEDYPGLERGELVSLLLSSASTQAWRWSLVRSTIYPQKSAHPILNETSSLQGMASHIARGHKLSKSSERQAESPIHNMLANEITLHKKIKSAYNGEAAGVKGMGLSNYTWKTPSYQNPEHLF